MQEIAATVAPPASVAINIKDGSMIMKSVFVIGILALASGAAASTEQRYVGLAEQRNMFMPIEIALRESARNDGIVSFDSPARCNIPIKLLKAEGDERTYRFLVSPNGGPFCDRLTGGSLVLKGSDDKTSFQFSDPVKNVSWSGKAKNANAQSAAGTPQLVTDPNQ